MTAKKSDELKPKHRSATTEKTAEPTEHKETKNTRNKKTSVAKDDAKNTALEEKIADLEKALQQEKENVLRTTASMINAERLSKAENQKARQFALESFAKELLPVIDSLELALSNGGTAASEDQSVQNLHEGVALTLKMLLKVIGKFHLQPIDPLGATFDPQLHQAVSTQISEDAPSNSVLQVLQKGYTLHDRLIRPAMVIVAS